MDEHEGPAAETELTAAEVGRRQIAVVRAWSRLYPTAKREDINVIRRGEIVFCAPLFYSREINIDELPEDLHTAWFGLLGFADKMAECAAEHPVAWHDENGLEKVHALVFDDNIKPEMRGMISEVARAASDVFDLSIEKFPNDLEHYNRYVKQAEDWLESVRESS